MKKLMYLMTALGAFAFTLSASAEAFETTSDFSGGEWLTTGSAPGAKYLKGDGTAATSDGTATDTLFYAKGDDASTVTNDPAITYSGSKPDVFKDATLGNYLNLSTEGGTYNRLLQAGRYTYTQDTMDESQKHVVAETAVDIPSTGLYIDTLVKFTASVEEPAEVADAKLVVFLLANEDTGKTNLCVRAKYWDVDGENFTQTNKLFKLGGDNAYDQDTWYRLTVKASKLLGDGTLTGFQVFINDSDALVAGEKTMSDAAITKYGITGAEFKDGTMFASLADDVVTTQAKLTAVGFQGTGAVTDFVATETMPKFLVKAFNYTLTIGEGVNASTVTYAINDGEATALPNDGIISLLPGQEVTFAAQPATGYKTVKLGDSTTLSFEAKSSVTTGTLSATKILAYVGDTSYDSMDDAVTAAVSSGNALKLASNWVLGGTQSGWQGALTIDLGGKKISAGGEVSDPLFVVGAEETLSLTNGTVEADALIAIVNAGTVIVEAGTEINSTTKAYADASYNDGENDVLASLTVNGGTFNGAIKMYDEEATVVGTVAINGGAFSVLPALTYTTPDGYALRRDGEEEYFTLKQAGTVITIAGAPTGATLSYSADETTWTPVSGTTITLKDGGTIWVKTVLADEVGEHTQSIAVEKDASVTLTIDTVDYGWIFKTKDGALQVVGTNGLVKMQKMFAYGLMGEGTNFQMSVANETIDMSGLVWEGIGTPGGAKTGDIFKGVFDGNGVTFNNLTLSRRKYAGLFNTITKATLKNFTVNTLGFDKNLVADNTTDETPEYGGAAVLGYGFDNAKLENITVTGAISATKDVSDDLTVTNAPHNVAGLSTKIDGPNSLVSNCVNRATILTEYTKAAGLVAFVQSSATAEQPVRFVDCANYGNVTASGKPDNADSGAGGFIGWVSTYVTFEGCSNSGKITREMNEGIMPKAGSFVGSNSGACITMIGEANTAQAGMQAVNPYSSGAVDGFVFATVNEDVATFVAPVKNTATVYKVMATNVVYSALAVEGDYIIVDDTMFPVAFSSIASPFAVQKDTSYAGDGTKYAVVDTRTDASDAVVTLTFSTAVYGKDGETTTNTFPTIASVTLGETPITDYTLSGWNPSEITGAGVYTNTLTFTGTYKGTAYAIFTVTPGSSPAPVIDPKGSGEVKDVPAENKDKAEETVVSAIEVPAAAAKDSGVDKADYQGYFTATAKETSSGSGKYNVEVKLDETKIELPATTKDVADQLDTIAASAEATEAEVVAKPGLYYVIATSETVGGEYSFSVGNVKLATTTDANALKLSVTRPSDVKGFFKVMVFTEMPVAGTTPGAK